MASIVSPARSALSNLAVNAVGTPIKSTPLAKELASRKRRIDEVNEPENAPAACKLLLSSLRGRDAVSIAKGESPDLVAASPMPPAPQQIKDLAETVRSTTITMPEEAPSPRSTASSMLDDDLDDTMESQQTAATEITQPLALGQVAIPAGPSRVSQHAETLRLRLRLAQFKVQTNQINIPFSQLRLSANHSRSPTEKTNHRSSSEDEADGAGVKEVEEQPALPRLLTGTQLTSSRLSSIREPVVPSQDPSSSPRRSESPENDNFRTPALPRRETGRGEGPMEGDSLTSSVVKGNAAIGLMGLRKER